MLKLSKKSTSPSFFLLEGIIGLFALTSILLIVLPQLTRYQHHLRALRNEVTCQKILQEVNQKHLLGEKIEGGTRDGYPYSVTYQKGGMFVTWQGVTASLEEAT